MKKVLLLILILLLSLPAIASPSYYIRENGIWKYDNNVLSPFIVLGDAVNKVQDIMNKAQSSTLAKPQTIQNNNGAFMGNQDSASTGQYIYNRADYDPSGIIFYTYNTLRLSGIRTVNKDNDSIKSIEIFSERIRTLKGVGVGNTCKEIWAAHGTNYKTELLNTDCAFYYTIDNHFIYFVVKNYTNLGEELYINSIIVF